MTYETINSLGRIRDHGEVYWRKEEISFAGTFKITHTKTVRIVVDSRYVEITDTERRWYTLWLKDHPTVTGSFKYVRETVDIAEADGIVYITKREKENGD